MARLEELTGDPVAQATDANVDETSDVVLDLRPVAEFCHHLESVPTEVAKSGVREAFRH